jgi:hypothetical protein
MAENDEALLLCFAQAALYNSNRSEDGTNITTKPGVRHAFTGRGGDDQG